MTDCTRRRVSPDPLTAGADLYDPKINRSYAELASYYGMLVNPARASKPKGKPRVERPMPYVRDSFWSGRTGTSLEHMQAEALLWAMNVAGQRQCRPLGGAKPLSVFEAVEAQALLPMPEGPFVLARWSKATVGPDSHIKVGRTLLGTLEADRPPCRCPLHRHDGAGLPRRRTGQDARGS
ncbi:hypothetical protein ACWGJT_11660 [Streptomyces xantholiticus]